MRSTTAKVLAKELLGVFSRVGFPREVLTDQGTNFMSLTFKQMWDLLGVKPLRTSIYHPQANGLVERFNRTLKGMLRKVAMEHPKKWHMFVNPLMFAVREAPQSSTGFSPFELLYGRKPRGILDLIRERWEEGEDASRSALQQIVEMRNNLKIAWEVAQDNLAQTQGKQKDRYDRKVKPREFEGGQKVLVLLPTETSKFLAKWHGPYEVIRRVSEVDYEVETPDRK